MTELRGGTKLKAKLQEMAMRLRGGKAVKAGFLAGATYPNGAPVAAIAFFQNYGTGTIPARPFFDKMIADNQAKWGPTLSAALKSTDYDAVKALGLVGTDMEGQIRKAIIDTNEPPLAPSTVARKGFAKPLIDTSHMINSVGHKVVA